MVSDIIQAICAEKRRYKNREINKKKRDAGIPIVIGRPKKEKARPATRKSKAAVPIQSLATPVVSKGKNSHKAQISKDQPSKSQSTKYIPINVLLKWSIPANIHPCKYRLRKSTGCNDANAEHSEPDSHTGVESESEPVRPAARKVGNSLHSSS